MWRSLKRALASRHALWVIPVLGLLLLSPAVERGLVMDDHVHGAALRGKPSVPEMHRGYAELFSWTRHGPAQVHSMVERGILPWWTAPELRLAFFRPIPGLSHSLDHRLWPDRPGLMHVHSLLWYALLVVALVAFYRRIVPFPAVAGLAALIFAVDDALTLPALWIANRNAVIAVGSGVVALFGYDRWRRDGWRPGAVLAPAALLVAVLSNEGAVAVGGYLVAYALFLDPAPLRRRLTALLPCAAVGIAWLVAVRTAGYGVAGSGVYVDPLSQPLRFLELFVIRAPLLFWGQWAWPPPDAWVILSPAGSLLFWSASLFLAVAIAWLLHPLLRDRPWARFLGLGMVLALVPAATTSPSGRLLGFVAIGGAGLLALLLHRLVGIWRLGNRPLSRVAAGAAVVILGGFHLVVGPASVLPSLDVLSGVERATRRAAASLPPDSVLADQDLVVVASPMAYLDLLTWLVRTDGNGPAPRTTLTLWSGMHGAMVRRPDSTTLVLEPRCGFLCPPHWNSPGVAPTPVSLGRLALSIDRIFRDPLTHPFEEGDRVRLDRVDVEVLQVEDGRPTVVAFTFPAPLESPRWRWVRWQDWVYRPFQLPAIGDSIWITTP